MPILRIYSLVDIAAAWREATNLADCCFARDGHVVSSAMFYPRDHLAYAATIFGDGDALERTVRAFGLKAIAEDVVAITRVSEVWMVDGPLEPGVRPRDSDKRYEALTVAAVMRHPATGKVVSHFGLRRIEREWVGKPSLSGNWLDNEGFHTCPLLESILPRRRPTALQRASARLALDPLEAQMRADRRTA